MTEQWAGIMGTDYRVSSLGRLRRVKRGTPVPIRPSRAGNGYLALKMCHNNRRSCEYVHRLVATYFIGDPPSPAHEVNHKDGDKANNDVSNLEWVTRKQNQTHAVRVLGCAGPPAKRGEANPQSKLTAEAVREIRTRRNNGEGRNALAREFKISGTHVGDIAKGKWWKPAESPSLPEFAPVFAETAVSGRAGRQGTGGGRGRR